MPGEQLLLINPRRRKRRGKVSRRRVYAKRRRARRANPVTHRRRRRRLHRVSARRRHANPRRRVSHRRRRRNPFNSSTIVNDYLMPGALGAVGGVALNYIWSALSGSLSSSLTGNEAVSVLVQAAAGVGLGILAAKAVGPTKGAAVGVGAVTVVLYNYLGSVVGTNSSLGGLRGLGARRRRRIGAYMPGSQIPKLNGMGAYMPGPGLRGLGAYSAMNPSPFVADPGSAAGDASEMFGP
jgi:hypothetical protein